ncbi:hypothetical protein ASG57_27635 [Bradyrhizobium sp. Leaf396]|jgi:hypothetical protein|nr:hypothetical protein ASG57_27635 [Bradyrhizobium sp. Leaf396]
MIVPLRLLRIMLTYEKGGMLHMKSSVKKTDLSCERSLAAAMSVVRIRHQRALGQARMRRKLWPTGRG